VADMEEAEVDTAAAEADMVATTLVVATAIRADTEAATTPAVDTAAVTIPAMEVMTVDTTQADMKEVAADIGVEVEDAVDLEAMAADMEEATLSLAPTEEVEEEEIHTALINLTKGRDINVFFSQIFYQTFFGSDFI